ncbi:hypothetical protein D9619_009107 [Psilocybe cf. subviscida]|uniref:Uncharacterized protein n=1 Tax=Psilocybe cf. subviscida TaxID=2480587 RepID=A0A8H5BUX2_9AGAR|nr:hypothetical protein D9619_009107 [Psilocybe cf. subviscida]
MLPVICTVPDDIPLHPNAPDFIDQGPGAGDCVATSSFTLIAEHQRVMDAKSRSITTKENIRRRERSENANTPKAQPVHHPRSKMARRTWVAEINAKRAQAAPASIVKVVKHVYPTETTKHMDSQPASEQQSSSETDENPAVSDQAAADARDAHLSDSMPPIPAMSSAPTFPSSTRDDAQNDDVGAGPTDAANTSQDPVLRGADEEPPFETAQVSRTRLLSLPWRMILPPPASTEETVLRSVFARDQAATSTLKNKPEKELPGKENNNASALASVSVAPSRRSQRILKRKRDQNENGVVDCPMDA